jgi:hypothetical protein
MFGLPSLRWFTMKKEYDFSKAEKGKFYVPVDKIKIPIYLDKKVQSHYLKLTYGKKIDFQTLINRTLKKQMSLEKKMTK